jgi:hypothetical protein
MPRRKANFAAPAFIGLLAGISATALHGQAVGEDQCLSAPKGESPAGFHWYYRVDRAEGRHCWYLRRLGSNASQAAPQDILPPAAKPPSQAPARIQPSAIDAHAEVRAPGSQDTANSFPVPAPPPKQNPLPVSPAESAAPPVVSSRWPELPAASSPWPSPPKPNRPANNAARESSRLVQADAAPAPLAAAASAVPGEPSTVRNLLATTIFVLMLAGITTLFASRRGRLRRLRRGDVRYTPGPLWETTDDTRIVLSTYVGASDYKPRFARGEGNTAIGRAAKRHFRRARAT